MQYCPSTYTSTKGLCLPIDEEERGKYLDRGEISAMVYGREFKNVILYTALISLSLGLINLFWVNMFPKLSVRFNFYSCFILLLAVGVLLLVIFDRYSSLDVGSGATITY